MKNIVIDGVVGKWYADGVKINGEEEGTLLKHNKAFYDSIKGSLYKGGLTQDQVDGINLLFGHLNKIENEMIVEFSAYILATVYHETDRKMEPIEEYYGSTTRYAPWYGRGYVQLTWEENYKKQEEKHYDKGEDYWVHKKKERALIPHVSADILVAGMIDGDFTGVGLGKYINGNDIDYVNARRVVNGTDKASTIASYAVEFEKALRAGIEG